MEKDIVNGAAEITTPVIAATVVDISDDLPICGRRKQKDGSVVNLKSQEKALKKKNNSKVPEEVKEVLRSVAPDAVQTIMDIMYNPETPQSLRIKCAEVILDRSYGKATQPIDANVDAGIEIKLGNDLEEYSK